MQITWTGNRFADFCVGALELDGLTVDPFDRHADGTGVLRQLGLGAEAWRAWLVRALAVRDEVNAAFLEYSRARGPTSTNLLERLPPWGIVTPVTAWAGAPSVGTLLRALWDKQEETGTPVSPAQGRAGWHQWTDYFLDTLSGSSELASLGRRVRNLGLTEGSVEVFEIDYPGPLADVPRPGTVLLCVRDWLPSPEEYVQALVRAIDRSQNL